MGRLAEGIKGILSEGKNYSSSCEGKEMEKSNFKGSESSRLNLQLDLQRISLALQVNIL